MDNIQAVTVDNLRIAYRRRGSGPPLVLLHGALVDSRVWQPQLEALSDTYTVVAWDAPGCGQSSDPPADFSLPDFAGCLAGFIDALDLERPHVLGLSFGGGLAIQFFDRYPNIPQSLILAGAYAGWAGSLPPAQVAERLEKGMAQSELPGEEVAALWRPSLFSDDAPAAAVARNAAIMADFHPAGMRAMLRAFAAADLREVLPRIDVPTLLLYGAEDKRAPAAVATKLHEQIPTSTLVFLPGTGHVSNLESPAMFNGAVRAFLDSKQLVS